MTRIIAPKYGPLCPNHKCPLFGMGIPMPAKGTGKCEISGAEFQYEIDIDAQDSKVEQTTSGEMVIRADKYKITGDEE